MPSLYGLQTADQSSPCNCNRQIQIRVNQFLLFWNQILNIKIKFQPHAWYLWKTALFVVLVTFGVANGQQSEKKSVLETLDSYKQAIVDNDANKAQILLSDSARILDKLVLNTLLQLNA